MRHGSICWAVLLCAVVLGGCGDDDAPGTVPILTPEPMGAPDDPVDSAGLRCIGAPPLAAMPGSLQLLGYLRSYADPDYADCMPPDGTIEVFAGEATTPLGMGFPDAVQGGRVNISIPVREDGFRGRVRAVSTGYVTTTLFNARPYTQPNTQASGWAWLMTSADIDAAAAAAGVTIDSSRGIVTGAVHDCSGFGIVNAVVRVAGDTDGVVYFTDPDYMPSTRCGPTAGGSIRADHFTMDTARTFTGPSGRFAAANVPPGAAVVEAFGRRAGGGSLELLSRIEVTVTAGEITAVDLSPRIGIDG